MAEEIDITTGINSEVWNAIEQSIENNSKETFLTLKRFVKQVFHLSIKNQSIKHFKEYIYFPAFYYSVSYDKVKGNSALSQLHKICSEQAASDLKEIISFGIGWANNKTKDINKRKTINIFYYWGFTGFSRLLYFIVQNQDINQFQYTLNEFEQISDGINNSNYKLESEIRLLERENLNGENNAEIKDLQEKKEIFEQFDTYKRHTLIGIKYWIYFLHHVDKINSDTALAFTKLIQIPSVDTKEMLRDILFFRKETFLGYLDWHGWDFKNRPNGKSYTPPTPHNWMTLGFMVDQIRHNSLYVNFNDLKQEELAETRFLYESLKEYSALLDKNYEKWKKILNVKTKDEFTKKFEQILSVFAEIKKRSINDKDRAIANAPLNQDSIQEFKHIIGKAWKSQAHIHHLFKNLDNRELVKDVDIKLKIIGQRTFFEKAKMMFIDGQHKDMIHGINQMGGETGRWEDNEFFSSIMYGEFNKVGDSSVLTTIDKALIELKHKNIVANIILLSPEYSYRDKEFSDSKRFVSKLNNPLQEKDLPFFYLGTFDAIPVYSSHSPFLKSKVIVSNFTSAFKMRYRTSPDWYEEELKVDVSVITDEEAERRLKEDPDKWKNGEGGVILSDEDALILIKTSVIIDIWTTLDFQVLDKEAYIVGYIKSESVTE